MLLIQDLNTDRDTLVTVNDGESEVQLTKEMFINAGLELQPTSDHNKHLEEVLAITIVLRENRNIPSAMMHNPAEFKFSNGEVEYNGHITDGHNIIIVQTVKDGDEAFQTVAYSGSRGRWLTELRWMSQRLGTDIGQLVTEEPVRYESTGPTDMSPHENASMYAIRHAEAGNLTPARYWFGMAAENLADGNAQMATTTDVMEYLCSTRPCFKEEWESIVDASSALRHRTMVLANIFVD